LNAAEVVLVRTGSANLASVAAALARLDVAWRISEEPAEVAGAAVVVLPGVGAFGPAMARLRDRGLDVALLDRVGAGRPLLAICLGFQLLCDSSDESPGTRGLGVIPGSVRRFADPVRVPQMGWNRIVPHPDAAYLRPGHAYFANSYCLVEPPPGWIVAMSDHGGPFVGAVERGGLLACQFHLELSGGFGLAIIERWLAGAPRMEGARC
jgi:imidazole glycerol-phosphate synthase subunit HisH